MSTNKDKAKQRYYDAKSAERASRRYRFNFTLINQTMIARLQRQGKVTLPYKKLDSIPRDKLWNLDFFNGELLKGLAKGETMDAIADRIFPEINAKHIPQTPTETPADAVRRDMQSAIRNARTMVTGAENLGRLDSYKELQDRGVVQKKRWLATPDDLTRNSHLDIDGEETDIDGVFSNGCEYPADPAGAPEEVYNCRCSLETVIVGYQRADGTISYVEDIPEDGDEETIHAEAMAAEKERRRNL